MSLPGLTIIGERINPTGRKKLAAEMAGIVGVRK